MPGTQRFFRTIAATDVLGVLRRRGPWAPSTAYLLGDVVTNGGTTYIVVTDHTSAATFSAGTTYEAVGGGSSSSAGATWLTGTLANRPTAGTAGRLYLVSADTETRNGLIYRDTGTAWELTSTGYRLARFLADAVADVPLRVTGADGQTANMVEVLNNAGAARFVVGPAGQLTAATGNVAAVPLLLNALTGVTADLQQWQVNGTTLARVSPAGAIQPARYTTANLPAASAVGVGAHVYDTTRGMTLVSNGTAWRTTDGADPSAGTLRFRGEWAASTAYAVGDIVMRNGAQLFTTTAHTSTATFVLANFTVTSTVGARFTAA